MPNNDSHQHVVKTTAQWDERAVEYWVVPRGCLCVELTHEGKTKLKVGEGNKYFKQLPYICDHGDLTNYYTKEEVDNLFDNLNRMAIMSTDVYDSKDDLPLIDNKLGDVRFVKSDTADPDLYIWIGDRWIDVNSSEIDPSDFVTKPEFNAVKDKVDEIYPKAHTHANKDILDGITQADREKFDDLHNYDDTELRRMIQETGHTHPNKALLDTITQSSLWSASDRTKFDDLHNYDDTEVKVRLVAVEEKAHTHANKTVLDGITQEKLDAIDELAATYVIVTRDIADLKTKSHTHANKDLLDGTTASFTVEQQNELYRLSQISTFLGAGPTWNGVFGYVPAPEAGQQTYYLRADGTWAKVKSGGDKYKAGEGIYILSGETTSDSFPFKVYSRAGHLEQYIIYGNTGGVGDAMIGGVYGVNITVTDEHGNSSNTSVILPEKISLGDYIDYGKQVFVHMRTNVSSLISSVDPSYNYRWAIYPDGSIQSANIGAYGNAPQVTTLIELEPGITYELYHQCDYSAFANYMNLNVYDTEQNRTRTIHFYDPVGNVPTIIALSSNEKYIRLTYEHAGWYPYTLIRVKAVETPITLPQIPLFPNSINTINVTNTIKPAEIYVEVAEPSEDDPDDPMSDYTGIIYNDGVLDVTQEDPTNLAELTIHFRDDVDKTITIPGASVMEGATASTDGEEGLVPAPLAGDENKFLRGDGTWVEVSGGSTTYEAGVGITFTQPGLTDLGFDFDAYIATVASMHNGTKTVDSEHKVLTLTATGNDCYTEPYSQVSAQYVYTFPIVAGHVYRLTWDSSNPSVSGRIFAFENVSETNLHWIDQSVQDYLEFTAVTSGTINFRFGVANSGTTISYSNIHFYEVDNFDPDTNIINADIAKGLEFDSSDKLQVKLGDGLHFDANDAIELDSNLYYPGQGIEFGGETLIPTEFNQSAFINVIGPFHGTISKSAALDSFTLTASDNDCFTDHYDGYYGYYITAEPNTKYRVSWESRNGTPGNMFVFEVSGTTYTGVMYIVNNANTNVNIFTTSNTCNKLSLRFGVGTAGTSETYSNITFDKVVPLSNVITAKLGNGLQFDSNGAIETTGGTEYIAGTGINFISETGSSMSGSIKILANGVSQATDYTIEGSTNGVGDSFNMYPPLTDTSIYGPSSINPEWSYEETVDNERVYSRSNDWSGICNEVYLTPGTYTYSLYVKMSNRDHGFSIYTYANNATYYPHFNEQATITGRSTQSYHAYASNTWERFSLTFEVTAAGYLAIRPEKTEGEYNSTIYVTKPQLVRGDQVTPFQRYGLYYIPISISAPGEVGQNIQIELSEPLLNNESINYIDDSLPTLPLYQNKVNTITVNTYTAPTRIFVDATQSSAGSSSITIENAGVIDIEQNPSQQNQFTVEFSDSTMNKTITIPTGVQYARVNTTDSYVLLHTKPADWDTNWDKYFELTYDSITTAPPDWDPTQHYKYENSNYVLGTAGDTFASTTWYDKHYVGLNPTTAVTFVSDVYYTGELHLIEDGETYDTLFKKLNEAIEHIERLEQEVQYLRQQL